jgi:hypothetical protein
MIIGETFITKLNYATFGCHEKYFNLHIENQELVVLWVGEKVSYVKDSNGEQWAIFNEDI